MTHLNSLKRFLLMALIITSFGLWTASAQGAPIDYVFMGTGVSGAITDLIDPNVVLEFDNADFVINILGDTADVVVDGAGALNTSSTGLTGTIRLFGGGLPSDFFGSFFDPLYVFADIFLDLVGFGTGTNFDPVAGDALDQLDLYIPGVGAYNLVQAPYGPVFAGVSYPGTTVYNYFDTPTSFGFLAFEDVENASFSVPEPTSMLLLSFGLLGLVGFRRKLTE